MKHAITLTLAALLSGITFAAAAADPQNISAGQRYYEQICAKCHEAGVGPNLKGRGFPPEAISVIARTGLSAMPAFRVTDIDDATLLSVGEYLSKTEEPKAAKTDKAAAAKPAKK